MTERDLCFLGLLALAFRIPEGGEGAGPARCPRGGDHPVAERPDGALWCLRCDEAFYPRAAEWDAALGPPPA